MINKQTVLRILEDRKARLTDSLIDDALEVELDVLINKINNLPEEDGWIPCSERLPIVKNPYKSVLLQLENSMAVGFIDEEGQWFVNTNDGWCADLDDKPVAWQPLPEPYKPPKPSWKESMLNKFLGGSSQ